MKRRDFLRLAAGFTAAWPACAAAQAESRAGKRVIVLGAGLAGLAAGQALTQAGHDVLIVEARTEPGGRVRTLREPFADGQHAESGALFVPADHDLTLRYIREFGLALEPALPLFESRLFFVRGRRLITNRGAEVEWPFDLAFEDRKLGRPGMWKKYVSAAAAALSREKLDSMSVAEFLRSSGASPEVMALLRVGALDMMGEGIESYSALQMLQRLGGGVATQSYTIRGGSDQLPKALAGSLESNIWYASPVVRIEPGVASASVVVERRGAHQRLTADHVVCTLPFSVLRRLDVSPSFSPPKTRAIDELPYTSVVRIFLQCARRAWTSEHLHFLTMTDLPLRWIFDHTVTQTGRRGILEAQAFGADARRLAHMAEDERLEFAVSRLEQIFPGVRKNYERGTAKCWDDDPWARGAFAYFRPGQMLSLTPHLARPEGRVHFAGDHTSAWPGWMQGALQSGLRAAREVAEAA